MPALAPSSHVFPDGTTPGEMIRFFRSRAGLSQAKLAKLSGCTSQTVKNWEAGRCPPSALLLATIRQTMGLSRDESRKLVEAVSRLNPYR